MPRYKLTTRVGPRVERERFEDIRAALAAIEARTRAVSEEAGLPAIQPKLMRSFDPVQRVFARLELSGPGRLRAGVDVRGDGSTEGYVGRVRRRLVEERPGESTVAALRRELGER